MFVVSVVLCFFLLSVSDVVTQSQRPEQSLYLTLLQNAHTLVHSSRQLQQDAEKVASDAMELTDVLSWNYFARTAQIRDVADTDPFSQRQLFDRLFAKANVTDKCFNQTGNMIAQFIMNTKTPWVEQIIDATGKPGSGILQGNMIWLGSYKECRGVKAEIYYNTSQLSKHSKPDDTFKGKYCLAKINLSGGSQASPFLFIGIQMGVCLPDSCSSSDATNILNSLLDDVQNITGTNITKGLKIGSSECSEDGRTMSGKAVAVLVVVMVFVAIILIGTFIDVVFVQLPMKARLSLGTDGMPSHMANDAEIIPHLNNKALAGDDECTPLIGEKKKSALPSVLVRIFLSFSLYTNVKKLLDTTQPQGTLTAVHGIRFISMTWIILGHSYVFGLAVVDNLMVLLDDVKRFSFQCIVNATFSVDTFFTLSGLLVAYLTLKEMKRLGKGLKMNWALFYFHRFWRLTPPYMLLLMVYVPLLPYIGSGPLWKQTGYEQNECEDTWWTNLLYINNIVKKDKMCMAWSWYLANDMQFYILSPLILIPFFYSRLLGVMMSLLFLITTLITTALITKVEHLSVGLTGGAQNMNATQNPQPGKSFQDIYMVPWCRMGPYVIGIMTGYLLYKTECKVRMSKKTVVFGWAMSVACALSVVYGLYDYNNGHPMSDDVAALYNSVSRSVWGGCICWVVFACATGHGGFVNTLLSWKGIIPLSRLTYCAYLVHPMVMIYYFYTLEQPVHLTDISVTFMFLSFLMASYGVAFIVTLMFEAPMMSLEKIFLKREKRA